MKTIELNYRSTIGILWNKSLAIGGRGYGHFKSWKPSLNESRLVSFTKVYSRDLMEW